MPLSAFAQRGEQTTTRVFPPSAAIGQTTRLSFFGDETQNAITLLTDLPATTIKKTPGASTFDLTLSKETTPGLLPLRVLNPKGVSSLLMLFLDDLLLTPKSADNHSPATAQSLQLPTSLNGATQELSRDYYRFTLRKGQRISVEIVAGRLGSRLDAVLRLLDSKGNELLYCDDDPATPPDPRFSFVAPADGDYLLELRDTNYDGTPFHTYHLRIGDFPLLSAPFPSAVGKSVRASIRLLPLDVTKDVTAAASLSHTLRVAHRGPDGSGFLTLLSTDLDEQREGESANSTKTPTPIRIPGAISGRFFKDNGNDRYRFSAAKGLKLEFRAATRSLGSPCDVSLAIRKLDGALLAQSKPAEEDEGVVAHTFTADGDYLLDVTELNRQTGPSLIYRIVAKPASTGFSLALDTDHLSTPAGSEASIKVTLTRREYKGTIILSAEANGKSLEVSNNQIASGKTEATLKLKIPATLQTGESLSVRIAGRPASKPKDPPLYATSTLAYRKLFPRLIYPPLGYDGVITLYILPSPTTRPATSPSRSIP